MRHIVKSSTIFHSRCDRTVLVLLVSTAAACLLAVVSPGDASAAFLPPVMMANALFLMNSSHHQRRPPSSRASGSGPSVSTSPQHESNTKRRRRESRSGSPLIVFYGMVLGRPGFGTESEKVEQTSESSQTKSSSKDKTSNNKFDDDFFSKDMIQRKQEFRQRYENFRGRGRWGGYSLVAMPQETDTRSPLPVVSTSTTSTSTGAKTTTSTTSVAETVTKSMKERQQRQRARRAPSMMQITDIQQYKDEVVDSTDSSLVVVRFYASWCKACKAIESSYHRLPQEFPSNVKFVEVPLTKENAYLHKGLGVPSLPFAHVYYRDGHVDNNGAGETSSPCRLVDEVKINKTKFSEFKRIIRSYVTKECDVHYHSGTNSTDESDEDSIMVTPSSQRPQAIADVTEEENEAIPVL